MADSLSATIQRIVRTRNGEISRAESGLVPALDLAAAITRIKVAYHDDWDRRKLDIAHSVLATVPRGIPIPALSVCGHGTAETRYTLYLAYFLSQSRLHGIGTRYLDAVLSLLRLRNPAIPDDIDTMHSIVTAEMRIGESDGKNDKCVHSDCDIVVTCPDHVVLIEQKIRSAESRNPNSDDPQLCRYDKAIDANRAYDGLKKVRIYLTPTEGSSPSSSKWSRLTHHDLAQAGINVLREGGISVTARENLRSFIVDLLLGPYESSEAAIQEMVQLAKEATRSTDFLTRLRFDQAVTRNHLLVDVLIGGSE